MTDIKPTRSALDEAYIALDNFIIDENPGAELRRDEKYALIDALVAAAREEGRLEERAGSRAGCFENQGNGTSKCAGCGFVVNGAPKLLGRVELPPHPTMCECRWCRFGGV